MCSPHELNIAMTLPTTQGDYFNMRHFFFASVASMAYAVGKSKNLVSFTKNYISSAYSNSPFLRFSQSNCLSNPQKIVLASIIVRSIMKFLTWV